MAKKQKGNGRTNGKQWFTTSEAARYLGVSVDKVRQLDESGELRASRTEGKHRRFARRALDAYLARHGRRNKPKVERPKSRPRSIPRQQPDPEPVDDEVDAFEPGDEDFEPFVEPPARAPGAAHRTCLATAAGGRDGVSRSIRASHATSRPSPAASDPKPPTAHITTPATC